MSIAYRGPARRAAATLALALFASSCGPDSSTTAPTPTMAPATATPTPTPAPTPTPTSANAAGNAIVQAYLAIDLDNPGNYANPDLPAYYGQPVNARDNIPANNPIDDRRALLGRVLFYDPALSVNGSTACATCHQQQFGFDDNERFSTGFSGNVFGTAHAMRLGNVRYWQPGTMFWDRRAASVEAQASQPILNPVEMGWQDNGGIAALLTRLGGKDYYPVLFAYAFGDAAITEDRMQLALANFERAMISSDSKWDRAFAQVYLPGNLQASLNTPLPGFSTAEERGRQLFMAPPNQGGGGCAACHQPPTFALDNNSRSNGLDAGETTVFKTPSLKNVGLSQFFMHDGRFTSLAQVIEHYDTGVLAGPALDNRLGGPNGNPLRLNLTQADRDALVAFLETLTDETLISDPRFSDPFLH